MMACVLFEEENKGIREKLLIEFGEVRKRSYTCIISLLK